MTCEDDSQVNINPLTTTTTDNDNRTNTNILTTFANNLAGDKNEIFTKRISITVDLPNISVTTWPNNIFGGDSVNITKIASHQLIKLKR